MVGSGSGAVTTSCAGESGAGDVGGIGPSSSSSNSSPTGEVGAGISVGTGNSVGERMRRTTDDCCGCIVGTSGTSGAVAKGVYSSSGSDGAGDVGSGISSSSTGEVGAMEASSYGISVGVDGSSNTGTGAAKAARTRSTEGKIVGGATSVDGAAEIDSVCKETTDVAIIVGSEGSGCRGALLPEPTTGVSMSREEATSVGGIGACSVVTVVPVDAAEGTGCSGAAASAEA
mmetsp:Transcript_40508/g.115858  ORF Transcript_40508/g.115858 Transcript_40508/m.115858 type:complete len:230 (+) Transcript_40508:252-941(+)